MYFKKIKESARRWAAITSGATSSSRNPSTPNARLPESSAARLKTTRRDIVSAAAEKTAPEWDSTQNKCATEIWFKCISKLQTETRSAVRFTTAREIQKIELIKSRSHRKSVFSRIEDVQFLQQPSARWRSGCVLPSN